MIKQKICCVVGFVGLILAIGLIGGVECGEPLVNLAYAAASMAVSVGAFIIGGAME